MTEDDRLRGHELRKARLERRITIARLAQLVDVDPRTVGRWESAPFVPATAVPALRNIFQFPDDAIQGPDGNTEAREDVGPSLRSATHNELLAEIARRLERASPDNRRYPTIPQDDVTWYTRDAPSARRTHNPDEGDERKRSSQ